MKRGWIGISLLLIFALVLTGCGKLTAEQVAQQVRQSYDRINDFHGVVVTESYFLGKKQVIRCEQWFKKPDKFRIEVADPKGRGLQTTICNGKRLWIYDRQLQEVVVVENPGQELLLKNRASLPGFMRSLQFMAQLKVVGQEKFAGKRCYVIEFTPKQEALKEFSGKQVVWLEAKNYIPLRIEEYDAEGKLSTLTYYEKFEWNLNLDNALFDFDPSDEVQRTL